MSNPAQRPALGQKQGKPICGTVAEFRHMWRVNTLPCVVCHGPGPSDAHHCRSDGMLRDDFKTIQLCKECHQGQHGYHNAKATWERTNGKDHDFLPVVADMLEGTWSKP